MERNLLAQVVVRLWTPFAGTKGGWTRRQRLALRAEQHLWQWLPVLEVPVESPLMPYRGTLK